MFIIKSTNPQLSFILSKNPANQRANNAPFSKSLRKGKIHSWYTDGDQEFHCLFIDSATETSLINAKGDFEYLDRTRYASPYLPIATINELLRTAVRDRSEYDVDGFEHEASFIVLIANKRSASTFINSFPEGTIELTQLAGSLNKAVFKSNESIYHLLNLVQVFCVIQTVADENMYLPLDEAACLKYAKSAATIDAPYFIRYLMTKMITSPKIFEAVRPVLEQHSTQQFKLNFGDTHQQRLNAILKVTTGGDVLWDVGCGELRYTRKLAGKYGSVIAFDADEEICEANMSRLEKYRLENVMIEGAITDDTIASHLPEDTDSFDILATEVIEHIEYEEALALLDKLNKLNFRKLVITVPNAEFNKHYKLEGFRHDDHKWEPTQDEFKKLIWSKFYNRKFTIANLGDSVDNVSTSLIAVIERI